MSTDDDDINFESPYVAPSSPASTSGDSGFSSLGPPSVASSIYDYQYENGRRYHNYRQGKYVLPCDEVEQDRLDMTHHTWLLMLGGDLFRAPLDPEQVKEVVDLGAGTGNWTIDFADQFPNANVKGVDLSPIQPAWLPPNLMFQIEDIEEKWTWSTPNSIDYIHTRDLVGGVSDWVTLLNQAYEHLKPGGYIELQEHHLIPFAEDSTYDCNSDKSPLGLYFKLLLAAGRKCGNPVDITPTLKSLVSAAGFEDVKEVIYKQPWNDWPADPRYKMLGHCTRFIIETGLEAYGIALFTRVLGMDGKTAFEVVRKATEMAMDKKFHVMNTAHIIVARKPLQ